MKRFALIGNPIRHSKSPALFKAAYGDRYTYNLLESENFNQAYGEFLQKYDGVNVTAPFKESAVLAADILSRECLITGSANTLVKTSEGIKAYNTDIDGVSASIGQEWYYSHKSINFLIVGSGGAGKSAAFAAADILRDKPGNITILNRNLQKAQDISGKIRQTGIESYAENISCFKEKFKEADCIIYTLPVRISGIDNLDCDDFDAAHSGKMIIEANYRQPAFTEDTLSTLRKFDPGLTYCPGEKWLLHQAIQAYRIFTGEEPDITAMSKVL